MYLQSIYLSVLGLGLQDIDVVFKCMVPSERDNLHLYSFLLFNPFSGTQVTSEQQNYILRKIADDFSCMNNDAFGEISFTKVLIFTWVNSYIRSQNVKR